MDYRAALALNNMALTMMQRGSSREAALTMKDSQSLMNTAFGLAEGKPQQALDAALARLYQQQDDTAPRKQQQQQQQQHVSEVDETDHSALLYMASLAAKNCSSTTTHLPLIRMVSFGESSSWVTRDVLRHSVTIYYNQALAYMALAQQLSSPRQQTAIRQRALEALEMAFDMMEDVMNEEREAEEKNDDTTERLDDCWYWNCLAVLTLQAQAQLYRATNDGQSKADETERMAQELANDLVEAAQSLVGGPLGSMESTLWEQPAIAAAA